MGLSLLTVLSTKHTSANCTVHPPTPRKVCARSVGLLILVLGNELNSRSELKRELVKWKKGQNEIQKRNDERHVRYLEMFYRVIGDIEGDETNRTGAVLGERTAENFPR